MATRPAAKRKTASPATSLTSARPAAKKAAVKAALKTNAPRRTAAKKPVRKPTAPAARKPVSNIVARNLKPTVAKSVTAVVKAKPVATKSIVKPKKAKVVRGKFSLTTHEHALLADLKKRAKKLGKEFKKSEFVRAGIAHLVSMTDSLLVGALSKVAPVKARRGGKKSKKSKKK